MATFRSTDSNPKEIFVHHLAGLGGYGGSSYIDSVIFRDRDANTAWGSAADSTREERRYYCQNWRADVSALLTSSGKLVEWVKYSAYGTPTALPTGDTDSDGDFDINDLGNMGGGYELRKDAELDGDVDANDINYAIANGYQTLGRGVLSSSFVANRKGYAGYENDGAIVRFAHVRNRVLDSTLGRWTRRDPLGYVDGMGLYEYAGSRSINALDSMGLTHVACSPPWNYHIDTWDECDCCDWAQREQRIGSGWLRLLPDCPCFMSYTGPPFRPVNPDPIFWHDPQDADPFYHPGAAHCMRSIQIRDGGPGQQCCYDFLGRLITDGAGAGTPDRVAPDPWHSNDGRLHRLVDVLPWKACNRAGMLDLYLQYRPPNNRRGCPPNGIPPPASLPCGASEWPGDNPGAPTIA